MNYFPEEVVEHVFGFVSSHKDRNSISLVCKSWHRIERHSRGSVLVANCYSITPDRVIQRFPALRSLTLKGKPHFADFNLVPSDWGGYVYPWINALARGRVNLEELRLKRMVVTDQGLDLISKAFGSFKSLVLVSCDGFSTDGLAAIAANCRHLRELDLQESEVEDLRGHWLSCFPENCTSLVTLNFACLKGDVSLAALERLVARSPNLKSLRLNQSVPAKALERILASSRLLDFGIGSFLHDPDVESFTKLQETIQKCNSIRSLSGFLEVNPLCLPAIHPICSNLTYLNLSYAAGIHGSELIKIIRNCNKLEKLWILDCIGDSGLGVVASCCKELQELRVFPSEPYDLGIGVTEEGLVAISIGCPKLNSILYFCQQMTNAALITVAKNSPNFIRFRLCILNPIKPDVITMEPLDEGFGAIVRSCRNIRRLSLSGLLTDKVFFYIGMYAENVEMLSVAFAGNGDNAMISILNGCRKLRKLEIMDSPFGDSALLTDVRKYETMRSLWMSSCNITLAGCKALAREMPRLNVEIIHEDYDGMKGGFVGGGDDDNDDGHKVEKMFLYRSLVGPRSDAPRFVSTLCCGFTQNNHPGDGMSAL